VRAAKASGPDWNPTKAAPTSVPVFAVITEFRAHEINGTSVQSGARKALVSAVGVVEALGELLKSDRFEAPEGQAWTIENIDALQPRPGGVVILYTLAVRK
jgi:hypothetical protein